MSNLSPLVFPGTFLLSDVKVSDAYLLYKQTISFYKEKKGAHGPQCPPGCTAVKVNISNYSANYHLSLLVASEEFFIFFFYFIYLFFCFLFLCLFSHFLVVATNQIQLLGAGLGGTVGCAVRLETRRSRVQPPPRSQHSFVEIDHEIFSMVILSLRLIQEGHFSVSGERMCTILVNRLED